jgi:hypothetical protein
MERKESAGLLQMRYEIDGRRYSTPNSDKHQELKGYFKSTGEMLFFGLKVTLILLYIFTKYLAIKSLILLKGLADIVLLPLSLTLAVFLGLTSEKFSIVLVILIYCLITYQISPKLVKPLFGDFGELRWVRIIVVALTCVYFYFGWLMLRSATDYVFFMFTAFMPLSSIPIGKVIKDKSDMVQCVDAGEKVKEEIIREYKGESDDPVVKGKITRCVLAYTSGLLFSFVCMLLGLLFAVFLQLNILLVMLLIVWLLKDLYYLMRKKSLFKLEELKNVFVGRHNPEKLMISSLLPFKRYTFLKQFGGLICILMGILWTICFCIVGFEYFVALINPIMQADYKDILAFLGLFSDFACMVSLFLALIFQLNFWYILIKRFPHFMVIWGEKDFSTAVDAPKLPTGGFSMFLVNTVIMVFLLSFYFLVYWIYLYLNLSTDTLMWKMLIFCIPILLLCFWIYITYYTLKNRRLREIDPNNLYKDNKRIPLAVTIQFFSLVLYPVLVYYATLQSNSALLQILDLIPLFIIVHCLVISLFYMGDILDAYIQVQDSAEHVKPTIEAGVYLYSFILTVILFILCYSMDYLYGTKSIHMGIFAFIVLAICIILTSIVKLYDKQKSPAIKKPPEK